ncbi:MAG: FecR family protein [Candidatus Hydrogenedentota bacterium]
MIKKFLNKGIFLNIFLLLPVILYASLSGSIIQSNGDVIIVRNNQSQKALSGTPVYTEDLIQTGGNSECILSFLDGSKISISENTKFSIKESLFQITNRKIGLKLDQGLVRSLVEDFKKEEAEFYIQTPQVVAGVRGTDFLTRTDPIKQITHVSVISGQVSVRDIMSNRQMFVQGGQQLQAGRNIRAPIITNFSPKNLPNIQPQINAPPPPGGMMSPPPGGMQPPPGGMQPPPGGMQPPPGGMSPPPGGMTPPPGGMQPPPGNIMPQQMGKEGSMPQRMGKEGPMPQKEMRQGQPQHQPGKMGPHPIRDGLHHPIGPPKPQLFHNQPGQVLPPPPPPNQ